MNHIEEIKNGQNKTYDKWLTSLVVGDPVILIEEYDEYVELKEEFNSKVSFLVTDIVGRQKDKKLVVNAVRHAPLSGGKTTFELDDTVINYLIIPYNVENLKIVRKYDNIHEIIRIVTNDLTADQVSSVYNFIKQLVN